MSLFQHLCGTDPHPTQFRAKKYKLDQRFIEKKDFLDMMQVHPELVLLPGLDLYEDASLSISSPAAKHSLIKASLSPNNRETILIFGLFSTK